MDYKRIFFILLLILPFMVKGQEYRVESFENVSSDLTARTESRVDNNGRKCGLIKVYVKDAITATGGPVIGDVVDRGMEKWVYVAHDAKKIQLLFKEHMPLYVIFDDYNYPTITGQMTYILKLKEELIQNSSMSSLTPTMEENSDKVTLTSSSVNLNQDETELSNVINFEHLTPKPLEELNPIIQNLINNMIYVEGGTFMMGSKGRQHNKDEKPIHKELIQPFFIGKYEVTQEEWEFVMGENPSMVKGKSLPVENVSWEACLDFTNKLKSMTGIGFRLPTEPEWEYAAKGGINGDNYKFSGRDDINQVSWHRINSNSKPHEIGEKYPNRLGIHDMSGNVAEWTSSGYNWRYDQPRSETRFVYRGGCYYDLGEHHFTTTYRNNEHRSYKRKGLGLRLAY